MKIIAILLLLCAGMLLLAAGCISQQPAASPPVPAQATTAMTAAQPAPVVTATVSVVPRQLVRQWTLTLLAARNGTEPMAPAGSPVTLSFHTDRTLGGNGGCNDYSAGFTLSGETTATGSAIAIGPVTATKMFCNRVASQETTYFSILQKAVTYTVDVDTLTITASDGTYLVFTAGNS